MAVPFDQRVLRPVQVSLPRMASVVGYCPAAAMTPERVERLVVVTETAIGEPIRHTVRKTFPQPLDRSIAEEVELAWKAPKRSLLLTNKLTRPNQVHITAFRMPTFKGAAYPADVAWFSISISASAPAALEVLGRLRRYAALSEAFMARADSPDWFASSVAAAPGKDAMLQTFDKGIRFVSEAGWAISERIGWGTYVGPRCSRAFGELSQPERIEKDEDGGMSFWLTRAPTDFRDEAHVRRHAAVLSELEPHWHPGTELGELAD